MDYIAVKDLKKTRELWKRLAEEKEMVITRDGKPRAVLVEISPGQVQESIREIRRGLFSLAVRNARRKAQSSPPTSREIAAEVSKSRKERGIS